MKIIIYYFSGTGNTKVVAKLLKDAFDQNIHTCDLINIEDILNNKISFDEDQDAMIGLAYPIHGGDAPEIIYDFVQHLPMGKMNTILF